MEKLHKYCLSVLLVIICSNISAQVNSGVLENEDYKQLYELYSKILNRDCKASREFCKNESSKHHFAIHDKRNANDIIGKNFPEKQHSRFLNNKKETRFSENEKYCKLLQNFEKNSKENLFTKLLYFKAKVSKVRNKDYLSMI
ncbi:hypothetical protein [Chryseobacterium taeanense]|uniref:hypothetical protein n=1 Tax=Chryseobacterium taeanense TaxID=311334 RepID=UPI0035AE397B